MILFKNQAGQKIGIFVASRTTGNGLAGIGGTITPQISKDGGTFANLSDLTVTDRGNGFYFVNLSQAETNGDLLVVSATSTDADAVIRPVQISTGNAISDVNVVQISGDAAAADSAELLFDTTLGTGTVDGYNILEALRIILAYSVAKASGADADGATVVFRNVGDTKDRITMTVDQFGNRTTVVLDAT